MVATWILASALFWVTFLVAQELGHVRDHVRRAVVVTTVSAMTPRERPELQSGEEVTS